MASFRVLKRRRPPRELPGRPSMTVHVDLMAALATRSLLLAVLGGNRRAGRSRVGHIREDAMRPFGYGTRGGGPEVHVKTEGA